ncbi:MAG: hypothetical protein Q7S26_00575 [bacterium]|nr:hypothetical protein [bacterium]
MQHRFKYTTKLVFIFWALFLILPASTQAASCSANGYTVVFVNGVFATETQARADTNALSRYLGGQFNSQPITYQTGYNQTHLAGAGDLVETYFPVFDTYDLNTILIQIHPEVTTRKLLVVGHSQGSVYTNKMYEYLVEHGEPASALGVYAVATPDSHVAGGGTYLTYELDDVINGVRSLKRFNPLPANVTFLDLLDLAAPAVPPPYHSFTDTYLAAFSHRIVSDINTQLSGLQPTNASDTGDCFTPPPKNVAYRAQQVLFAVADPTAQGVKVVSIGAYQGTVAAARVAVSLAKAGVAAAGAAFGFVSNIFSGNPVAVAEQRPAQNFEVVKKLYGSSLSPQDLQDLLGSANQGAAVALAVPKAQPGIVLGAEVSPTDSIVKITTDSANTIVSTTPVAQATSTVIATTTNSNRQSNALDPATWGVGGGGPAPSSYAAAPVETATTTSNTASRAPTTTSSTTATTTATSTTSTIATSTSTITTDIASTSATSTLESATTSMPFVPQAGNTLADTFDTYNSAGWQSVVRNNIDFNFSFDDGGSGNCFRNGCVVGIGSSTPPGTVPLTYLESNPPLGSGAFTFYGKARRSFMGPIPIIVICNAQLTCTGSMQQIAFLNLIPLDDSWRHYWVAWRQGTSHIESCALTDDTNSAHCAWVDTGIALGAQFDGIRFGSQTGYRNDLGENLWFDELVPVQ